MQIRNSFRTLSFLFLQALLLVSFLPQLFSKEITPSKVPLPNVLLITIDSLRPDHLGCYGYDKPTSPWIDRIAGEGTLFQNALSQSGWTSPAMVSILTSLYPSVHGVESRHDAFPCRGRAPLTSWEHAGYKIPGYETVEQEPNYSRLGFEPDPEYGFSPEQLTSWIRTHRSQPFFCWYHVNKTPHLPYRPEDSKKTAFPSPPLTTEQLQRLEVVKSQVIIPKGTLPLTASDLPGILPLYDGEVRMADDTVGRIYEFLREERLLDSTVILLTADHGDELLDHGFIGHASTNWAGTLYEEIVHVPLIIRYPSAIPHGKVVTQTVRTIDILPTLHALTGISAPFHFQGESLLPLLRGEGTAWPDTAFAENTPCGYQCDQVPQLRDHRIQSVRAGSWKLLATHTPQEVRFSLFDLSTDPGEKQDQLQKRPDIAVHLKDLLLHQNYLNRILRSQILHDCSGDTPQ
jgi:choline-sulfatase